MSDHDDSAVAETVLVPPGTAEPAGALEVTATQAAVSTGRETTGVLGRTDGDVPGQLGRYLIGEPLGSGGMGRVYRAQDPDLNRDVAIKVLHPTEDGSGQANKVQQRLLREAQAMAKLSHQNLAIVFDVGTTRDDVFIAMELIEGPTLRQWLRLSEAQRSWRARLTMLTGAGRGLAAAHSAGVIHRDFKPDNVLVGADGIAKVVDFGLARGTVEVQEAAEAGDVRQRGDMLSADLTMTGAVMGTPAYMSPEQHAGDVVDARSDQFSFAVAVYEALYGGRPFFGVDVLTLAQAVSSGEVLPAPDDTDVPAYVFTALSRALNPDPDHRWPSLDALLAELAQAVEPQGAAPEQKLRSTVVRWPVVAGITAAVGLAVLAWFVLRSPGASEAPPGDSRDGRDRATQAGARPAIDTSKAIRSSQVRAVVRSNRTALLRCHLAEQHKDPSLPGGTLTIEFEIGPKGRVVSTRIGERPEALANLATCVAAASLSWQFPAPAGGRTVTVAYPFEFSAPPKISVERVNAFTFRVHRTALEHMATGNVSLGARLVPNFKVSPDGRTQTAQGTRLFAIRAGSVASSLGFRNGDTVRTVAGATAALTDPRLLQVFERIRASETRVEVTLIRQGKPLTFTYLIE